MLFITEKIPVEFSKTELFQKLNHLYEAHFSRWTVSDDKSVYVLKIKSSSRVDDEDFGVYYILMGYKGYLAEAKVRVDAGENYRNCILEALNFINSNDLSKSSSFPFDVPDAIQNLENALPEFFRATYGAKEPISLTFINSLKMGE